MTDQDQFTQQMSAFMGAVTDLIENSSNNSNASNSRGVRLKLPDSYDGTRDAVLLERWIAAIERHQRFYGWDGAKTMEFASTLLTLDADTWYRMLEASTTDAPKEWLELKRLLVEAFKPPNARTLARDRLRACVQHGTIQEYVNEFQNIKLCLPTMQEEEAIDRFVSGLADDDLVAKIRDVDEQDLTLRMALNMALSFEAARRPRIVAPTPSEHCSFAPKAPQQQQLTPDIIEQHPSVAQHQPATAIFSPIIDRRMQLNAMQGRDYENGCFYCGKLGHVRDECRSRERDIKILEQHRYNELVRSAQQQPTGNKGRGGRGARRNRGRAGGSDHDGRAGHHAGDTTRGSLNTTETSAGGPCSPSSSCVESCQDSTSSSASLTALPYAHAEVPKLDACHVDSLLPIELKPILYDQAFTDDVPGDNNNNNNQSTLYHIHDAQHLLQLNHTTSLPVYASVAGQTRAKVHVLIDSGASDNYVSSDVVPSLHVDKTERVHPPREVETADGTVTMIKDKVTFWLSINGEYRCRVTAYVFPTKCDLILGRSWLKEHSPRPVWATDSYLLGQEPHVVEIKPVPSTSNMPRVAPTELNYLITHKQADRELKHGGTGCLLYIKDVYQGTPFKPDSKEQQDWIDNLVKEFDTVFKNQLPGLPPERKSQHVIQLEDPYCKPVNRAPFRMSPAELDELRRQLKELLDLGLIRPSTSPWGAPVLFVRKKDGKSLRMCIDYRALNKLTVKNHAYLPRIDECLDKLQGASYFTCLDLKSGYFQIRLQESDIPYTAFNSRYGKYEWRVLAQGLTNAPLSFQVQMNDILGDCLDKYALCYLDDICVFSFTFEQHKQHVQEVLSRLKQHQFVVNKDKCKFAQRKLVFLGYEISQNGILPAPSKVQAVSSWPRPKNVQEVRQFIGLAQHYRRFIPGFAGIAAPLTNLTRGDGPKRRAIKWSMECETSFARIKKLLTEAPVLQLPDMATPFRIETDSSDFGIGAVLLQPDQDDLWHPVAYESKKLSDAERKYPAQERELLAIIHALRAWRCFVDGCPAGYTVVTDHKSLEYLMSQQRPAARLYRWMIELAQFSPNIVYKSGSQHVVPDALSRIGGPSVTPAKRSIQPAYINALMLAMDAKEELEQDWPMLYTKPKEERDKHLKSNPKILRLLAKEEQNIVVRNNQVFHLEKQTVGGRATVKEVPYVPFCNRLDLVSQYHEGFGHASARNLGDLLQLRHWWPTMKRDLSFWIKTCPSCQLNANKSTKHRGEMHPLTVPKAFERWHLNFIGELPMTIKGNKWIITAVDSLTNWPVARAVPVASAEATADFIYEEIMMRFGCPVEVITDRGSQFKSNLIKAYSARVGVTHKLTSAFHPRTNSKVERFNGIIKPIIRKYVNGAIHRWDDFLDASLWACRIRTHTTTGFSPFYLTYGRDPRIPGDPLRPYIDVETAKDPRTVADFTSRELEALGQYRAAAEFRLEAMAEKDKIKWDAAIRPLDFELGDKVLMTNEGAYGLEPKWKGPYIVVASYPDYGTYKLETLQGEPLDSLVHVDRLKLAHTFDDTRPSSTWYEPSSSLRRAPAETPSYFASGRPMNQRFKSMGGGEASKQPPQPASELDSEPLSCGLTPTVQAATSTPTVPGPVTHQAASSVVSVASSRRSSVQHYHDSPAIMEDIDQPDIAMSPPLIVLEQVVLEAMSCIPVAETPPSSDIAMSPSSTEEEDAATGAVDDIQVGATQDQGIQTELEDTAMETSAGVGIEDQGTQTEAEDIAMIEETPAVVTEDQGTQTEDMSTQQPPSQIHDVPMSEESEAPVPATTAPPDTQDPMVLSDPSSTSKEILSDTTGLTPSEKDSIVAKLMEVIKRKKQATGTFAQKEEPVEQPDIEIQEAPHSGPSTSDPKQPSSLDVKDPSSSSRAHLKRPPKRDSDSDQDSNEDDKIQGVPGVTLSKVGANVNDPIDMPWFIARWNKNKKRVFKPNKLVQRFKKRKHNEDSHTSHE